MLDDHQALAGARTAYAYAPFRLRHAAESDDVHAVLWDRPVTIQGPKAGDAPAFSGHSSWDLDQHHNGLLRSKNSEDVLLGVASVTFWGFGQGSGGRYTIRRGLSRAKWIAAGQGQGQREADAKALITEKVRNIASLLDRGERQAALREAMSLKHHGLAFASKLLAFTAPDTECVYDEVISLRLRASTDPRLKQLYVPTAGQHRLAEKAVAYEGWAQLCTAKALELNDKGVRWKDWDGQERAFRAVDVERAFFGLGRPSRG